MERASGVVVYTLVGGRPRFLLLRNARHGSWGFPKGHVEDGESDSQAALRELREETGIEEVFLHPGFEAHDRYAFHGGSRPVEKSVVYYLGRVRSQDARLSKEHDEMRWGTAAELAKVLQFPNLRQVLTEAEAFVEDANQARPDWETALDVLLGNDRESPQPWQRHSIRVSEVAHRIALALHARGHDVDPDEARLQGLWHDIGRKFGHGPLHGWEGFLHLQRLGLPAHARACLTHWLKGRTKAEVLATSGLEPELVERMFREATLDAPTLLDDVMSLADALVKGDQVVSLDERYADVFARYGESEWLRRNAELARAQQAKLETLAGRSVAEIVRG
jgi:bis(5'-nucleosidyl)-tetraphosphatase